LPHRQDGQILPGLVILMIAVLALGVLAFGVGRAAILRSDAQTAADAAALAGARDVRDQLVAQVAATGNTDLGRLDRGRVQRAAEEYAAKNGAELRQPVTLEAGDVRVWVRTRGDAGNERETEGEARARGRVEVDPLTGAIAGAGGGAAGGGAQGRYEGISDEEWRKFAKTISQPPKCSANAEDNDVTKLGKFLRSKGISVIESAQMGDRPAPGVHSATGQHYQCDDSGALDINNGPVGVLEPAMDAIRPRLQKLGFFTIWREADHFDHMHVDAGPGSAGGGGAPGSFGDAELEIKLVDWEAPAATDVSALFSGGGGANPFGPPDPQVAAKLCQALEETRAGPKARLALWMAAIVESGVHDIDYGHSSSVGVLQLLDIHLGGSVAKRRDVVLVSKLFLRQGFTGKGGAIEIARRNPGTSAGQVAQAVQGSAFPDRYDERRLQALALDERFCK